jgi:hypothetical protein
VLQQMTALILIQRFVSLSPANKRSLCGGGLSRPPVELGAEGEGEVKMAIIEWAKL